MDFKYRKATVNGLVRAARELRQTPEILAAMANLLETIAQEEKEIGSWDAYKHARDAAENFNSFADEAMVLRAVEWGRNPVRIGRLHLPSTIAPNKQPSKVVDGRKVKQFVGIGWVTQGPANVNDYETLPVVTDMPIEFPTPQIQITG